MFGTKSPGLGASLGWAWVSLTDLSSPWSNVTCFSYFILVIRLPETALPMGPAGPQVCLEGLVWGQTEEGEAHSGGLGTAQ